MSDYLLDTNILILCFRKTEGYRELLDTLAKDDILYILTITRLEIVRGMREHERKDTFNLLNSMETIDVTIEIADKAGELIRLWRTKGMILGDADAVRHGADQVGGDGHLEARGGVGNLSAFGAVEVGS